MKIEEQATSLSLFGIFLSDRPIRMAAVLVSSFQLPQFNRKILFPPVAKEFGSVGVIGNPMGFVRNVGIDLKDFLAVTAKGTTSLLSNTIYATSDAAAQGNPTGFAKNVEIDIKDFLSVTAKGTTSLLSSTVYAISDAAAQGFYFSSIVAFTFDDQAVAKMEIQQKGIASHSNGVLNEFFEEFGYAGVIGNPMGFARNVGIDIKDFLLVTAKGTTTSLLSNTVYAISVAAAQGNLMGFARNVGLDIKDFLSVPAKGILQVMGLISNDGGNDKIKGEDCRH
ncbi:hypothetical protein HHK36_000656 [Tetracentron sinense]|uniref:Uncharacterized protein n=1 Tax=Tetracentron sinense TaxID=13715 RepID=A0A834ZWS1_TETSI|nr:hypothetical protein HHK36_000656 [Tetracentron sinense]